MSVDNVDNYGDKIGKFQSIFSKTIDTRYADAIVRVVIKQYILRNGGNPIGSRKQLRKLRKKVEALEMKVEQLEKKTNESRAFRVASWTLVILEIAVAIIAILSKFVG